MSPITCTLANGLHGWRVTHGHVVKIRPPAGLGMRTQQMGRSRSMSVGQRLGRGRRATRKLLRRHLWLWSPTWPSCRFVSILGRSIIQLDICVTESRDLEFIATPPSCPNAFDASLYWGWCLPNLVCRCTKQLSTSPFVHMACLFAWG